jgi:transposase-like protein
MTSSKLAIADKQEILRLYCETDLSTVKLSKQFGISTSSTLRLLQEMMSPEEYREAVQRKQSKPKKPSKPEETVIDQLDLELTNPVINADIVDEPELTSPELPNPIFAESDLDAEVDTEVDDYESEDILDPEIDCDRQSVVEVTNELVGGDILDLEDDDEFDEDEDDDDEDDDEDTLPTQSIVDTDLKSVTNILVILPLDQAELSNICYIVVDKASEIVTRPMRDFKELGKVPTDEINLLAMPVFDNHRAARRFSAHNQKVIKFPSSIIHATRSHLSQKGITRLLYGGQIFAL